MYCRTACSTWDLSLPRSGGGEHGGEVGEMLRDLDGAEPVDRFDRLDPPQLGEAHAAFARLFLDCSWGPAIAKTRPVSWIQQNVDEL
jgi:hypothetical protein